MSTKGISVVIPNYNGRLLLEQILPPLFAALQAAQMPFEVIISDDFSTDDSVVFVQQQYPKVKLICNSSNRGFSPAINSGIFEAQYDYVLLLNSDVKLEPGYFGPLIKYFERPDTFGVMGRIVGWDDDIIQDAAKYPSFHGVKIKTSRNYILKEPALHHNLYSMYLSGANALVSREKLLKLEGFNELFAPYYVEDVDLSLRAWRLGWKCYYEHDAVCRHKLSTTIKSKDNRKTVRIIYNRNKMFLHAIHLQGFKRALWFVQLFAEAILQTLTGHLYFLKSMRLFFMQYAEVQNSRELLVSKVESGSSLEKIEEVTSFILGSIGEKDLEVF